LYDVLLPRQRIIPVGSCGSVGLGGLTLGGGYGFFSREYGLTCDSLLEATAVDGNGLIHSTKKNPDLPWAIRGGGTGSFAIATEFVFQTYSALVQMQVDQLEASKLNVASPKSILIKWFTFYVQIPLSSFSAYILNGHTLTVLITG